MLPQAPEPEVRELASACGLRMPAARVLWGRGVRDPEVARRMLAPDVSGLHDPFLMLGMDKAV